jgi:hypothetical protein
MSTETCFHNSTRIVLLVYCREIAASWNAEIYSLVASLKPFRDTSSTLKKGAGFAAVTVYKETSQT